MEISSILEGCCAPQGSPCILEFGHLQSYNCITNINLNAYIKVFIFWLRKREKSSLTFQNLLCKILIEYKFTSYIKHNCIATASMNKTSIARSCNSTQKCYLPWTLSSQSEHWQQLKDLLHHGSFVLLLTCLARCPHGQWEYLGLLNLLQLCGSHSTEIISNINSFDLKISIV